VAHMEEKRNAYVVFKGKAEENKSLKRCWNRWVNIKMNP
jgi:hypothetical protein